MKNNIYTLILLSILYSCSPKIRSSINNHNFGELENTEEIIIIKNETLPNNSIFIGDIKIGDSGFTTDCSYNKIMSDAKSEASKVGGNIIKIIELKKPVKWGSTCYQLKAKIYRNLDSEKLYPLLEKYTNRNKSRLPVNSNYAKIYIYRPKMLTGSIIGYNIRMDTDSVVCRVKNGAKCEIKTSNFGEHKFWAKIDNRDTITLNIKEGQEYFIRCSVGIGLFAGRPKLDLIENHIASKEFDELDD